MLSPSVKGSFDATAVKDPSIVYAEGNWRLFYTARGNGKYSLGYVAAPTLEGLATAPRIQLPGHAAPQVFFFRPKKEWFLISQTAAANYQPVYSTTKSIGDAATWSAPQELVHKQERAKWIDFWVICDERNAYLFFTRDHEEVVALQTTLAAFPEGWGPPVTVFHGVHEAVHVYRESGRKKYGMIFELREPDLSRRYALAEAEQLLGPWHVVDPLFAHASHGELLRTSSNELLEADFRHPKFLIQALLPGADLQNYPELPWRLELLR